MLERAGCKKVRFHDLRHTFATMAISNGMDIKTLSAIIGHVSSETTLDIYLHSTDTMRQQAAEKIDQRFGKNMTTEGKVEQTPSQAPPQPPKAKFEPTKGKRRKPGTGCISKINDYLYEGKHSPTDATGKRIRKVVYTPTRDECEEKLAKMIKAVKAEITAEKEKFRKAQ